jgi:hypothetical protein
MTSECTHEKLDCILPHVIKNKDYKFILVNCYCKVCNPRKELKVECNSKPYLDKFGNTCECGDKLTTGFIGFEYENKTKNLCIPCATKYANECIITVKLPPELECLGTIKVKISKNLDNDTQITINCSKCGCGGVQYSALSILWNKHTYLIT